MSCRASRIRRRAGSFILIVALGCLISSPLRLAAEVPAGDKPMSAAEDAFARALYGQLAQESGNLAVSPTSVRACVLLALAGARGETAQEIAGTLKLSEAELADVGRLLDLASTRDVAGESAKVQLTVANSAWVQQGFPIHTAYRKLLETNGRATFRTVNFADDALSAVDAINAWVDEATRHRIAKLLTPNAVDNSTRLVLANAVYFKGDWQIPFDERYTKPLPFHRPEQPDVEVPLMHNISRFGYLETDTYQAVELQYAHGPYSMVVWLPRDAARLDRLEAAITGDGDAARLDAMQHKRVDLFLPRFKVSGNASLGKVLADMGMAGAFRARPTSRASPTSRCGSRP